MGFSNIRRGSFAVFAVAAFVLASCGAGDDDNAAGTATTQPATAGTAADTGSDTADSSGDSSGDVVTVNDIGDIPKECVDMMGDYLKQIEPYVKDIDWKNASLDQLQQVTDSMGTEFSSIDSDMTAAGCDKYNFSNDEDSMKAAIQLAKDRAPGTVAWLEYIEQLSSSMASVPTSPATTPSGDGSGTGGASASGLPTDCAGAEAFVEGLMTKADSMLKLDVGDQADLGQVSVVIFDKCPTDDGFWERADVAKFMSGN